MLSKIVSCYDFIQYYSSTIIFTCRRKLVSYYPPKGFVALDQDYQYPKNALLRVRQLIHAVNMLDSDYLMIRSTVITSVTNTTKNIYLSATILNELNSTYYDDKNDPFEILFQQYTASAVKNIYHPAIIEENKANTDNKY